MLTVSTRLNVSCTAFCTEMAQYRCNDDCHLQITAKFANRSHASQVWCLFWYGKINARENVAHCSVHVANLVNFLLNWGQMHKAYL